MSDEKDCDQGKYLHDPGFPDPIKLGDIDAATREGLANELGAAGEYTEDWMTADMDDLRERVRRAITFRDNA
jgi:hypothetical protein